MNYRKTYLKIVSKAKREMEQGIRPTKHQVWYEFHHILPKSLFPSWANRKSNIVCLTYREHFFCHVLLCKIYPTFEMYNALCFMNGKNNQEKYHITSKEYARIRKQIAESAHIKENCSSTIKSWWNNLSAEQYDEKCQSVSKSSKAWWDSLSDEERQQFIDNRASWYAKRTDEEIAKWKETHRRSSLKVREMISAEKQKEWSNNISKQKQEFFASEESAETRKKMSEAKKKMTEEERKAWAAKKVQTMHGQSAEKRQEYFDNASKAQKERFKNMSEERFNEINDKRKAAWKNKDLTEFKLKAKERQIALSKAFDLCKQNQIFTKQDWVKFRHATVGYLKQFEKWDYKNVLQYVNKTFNNQQISKLCEA